MQSSKDIEGIFLSLFTHVLMENARFSVIPKLKLVNQETLRKTYSLILHLFATVVGLKEIKHCCEDKELPLR